VAYGEPQRRSSQFDSWLDYSRIDAASEFILKAKTGSPPVAAPDIPPIVWEPIASTGDLLTAVNAMLGAHTAGLIDGSGLKFLTGIILDLARVFETVELAPEIKRIKERLDEREAVGA
jgi:hypothetical protein